MMASQKLTNCCVAALLQWFHCFDVHICWSTDKVTFKNTGDIHHANLLDYSRA